MTKDIETKKKQIELALKTSQNWEETAMLCGYSCRQSLERFIRAQGGVKKTIKTIQWRKDQPK